MSAGQKISLCHM